MTRAESVNEATVLLRPGPLVAPVLSRVVGMLAARAQCPIDRLDDALLLADAVAAHAGALTLDGRLGMTVSTCADSIELRVGPLQPDGGRALVAAAEIPGVGNVLERVSDSLAPEAASDGSGEHLVIRLDFAA